jgi:hypothetical protein
VASRLLLLLLLRLFNVQSRHNTTPRVLTSPLLVALKVAILQLADANRLQQQHSPVTIHLPLLVSPLWQACCCCCCCCSM